MKELIILDKKDFKRLNKVDAGSEGDIIKIEYNNNIYAFKNLHKKNYKNKSLKLNYLYNLHLPANVIRPSFLVNNEGYLMPYLDRCINLGWIADGLNISKKIEILKRLKLVIEYLNKKNIIYGDMKCNNIFYDGENPILIDIDNIITEEYGYDLETHFMSQYFKKTGKIDINLDRYNLNLFTYCFINDIASFRRTEEYIIENQLTNNYKNFHDVRNQKIIKKLINFNGTYTDDLLIDNLADNII